MASLLPAFLRLPEDSMPLSSGFSIFALFSIGFLSRRN
jgi:hypothetical protein